MDISKKMKALLFSCFALLLLSIGVFAVVYFRASQGIPTEEKILNPIYPLWAQYDINSAADEATTIVYGTMGPSGKLKKNEIIRDNGEIMVLEHYREAEIQVIQMIKGDMDAQTVPYFGLSSEETEDRIYYYEGAIVLEEGKNYLFFLNKNGAYLSPSTVMEVDENGILIPPWSMRIENEAQACSDESLPVSLDDYIAEVRQYLD